jgi:hypothetical protein
MITFGYGDRPGALERIPLIPGQHRPGTNIANVLVLDRAARGRVTGLLILGCRRACRPRPEQRSPGSARPGQRGAATPRLMAAEERPRLRVISDAPTRPRPNPISSRFGHRQLATTRIAKLQTGHPPPSRNHRRSASSHTTHGGLRRLGAQPAGHMPPELTLGPPRVSADLDPP